jgi:hypothetical protein
MNHSEEEKLSEVLFVVNSSKLHTIESKVYDAVGDVIDVVVITGDDIHPNTSVTIRLVTKLPVEVKL